MSTRDPPPSPSQSAFITASALDTSKLPGFSTLSVLTTPLSTHRIALRALAHAIAAAVHLEPDGAGEVAVAVGEHLHLAVGLLVLAPGVHHERVVDREAGDGVDAFLLEL